MPDEFTIVPEGLELSERELQYLARMLVDLRSFWPLVSEAFIGWVSEQFKTEGQSWTEGWVPLSAAYRSWKEQNFPGKGILSMYGDLRRAATSPRRIPGPTTLVMEIEPFTHSHSGRQIEPGWFQEGTDRMPARPLIGDHMTLDQEGELQALGERYVTGLLEGLRI
jgi:hypothetical protein